MRNVKNLTICVLVLAMVSTAAGATIDVPGDYSTIQAAINAAVSGVDEIEVAPGTYNEAINFHGKAIRMYSSGGPEVTTIDATGKDASVVTCANGEGSGTIIEGFTITGGSGTAVGIVKCGGGMYNSASSPTVKNCTFTGNSAASFGGGMWNFHANPTVTDCTFSNNEATAVLLATGQGGGMHNSNSNPTLTNCTFSGNTSRGAFVEPGKGGGMYNYNSSPTMTECNFNANTASCSGSKVFAGQGGGIHNSQSSPTLNDCDFSANTAGASSFLEGLGIGGGMYNGEGSSPQVTDCTFSDNTDSGMFNEFWSDPTVSGCSFSGKKDGMVIGAFSSPTVTESNFSGNDPAGIWNKSSSNPTVTDCTFSGNWAGMQNEYFCSSTVTDCNFSGNITAGIWNKSSSSSTVTHCTFTGNNTGIWNELLTSSTVTNCTFTQNTLAGMENWTCNPTVTNCVFTFNIRCGIENMFSSPNVTNCTFTDNYIGIDNTICGPKITNCILWNNTLVQIGDHAVWTSVTYSNVEGGYYFPGAGNIDQDPMFADSDGRLLPGSPCIDAGNNSAVSAATDLDGNPRIVDGNFDMVDVVDMGAYECVDVDADDDGIEDSIDTEPYDYSDDFDDGTTSGTILDRADQIVVVSDEPDPLGVKIEASGSVGAEPAQVSVCGMAAFTLDAGDTVVSTCGSVEITVVQGTVEIVFFADDGTEAQTSLNAGNSIEFEPETFTFTAPATNTEDVVVVVDGVEIVLAPGESKMFIWASIDIDPDVLNLKSKGTWITCYIELPEGFDAGDIDVSTVMLNGQVPAELHPTAVGDNDGDGVADLMVKFDLAATQATVEVGDAVQISVAGELDDGTVFEGSDTIRVIEPGGQNK